MTLCGFDPDGRQCPHPATVAVTLTGCGLPPHEVPTCDEHLNDWLDDVAATARPLNPESAGESARD